MNTDIKLSPGGPEAPGGGEADPEKKKVEMPTVGMPEDQAPEAAESSSVKAEDGSEAVSITMTKEEKEPAEQEKDSNKEEEVLSVEGESGADSATETDANMATEEMPKNPTESSETELDDATEKNPEHKMSSHVADLRTPEGEQAKREAEEAKERALADQAEKSAHIAVNNADTVKPPTTAQASSFELEDEDEKKNGNMLQPTEMNQATTDSTNNQPPKKPGFFARLFGKK